MLGRSLKALKLILCFFPIFCTSSGTRKHHIRNFLVFLERNCIWQPDLSRCWCQWASEVYWKSHRLWSDCTFNLRQMTPESEVRQTWFFWASINAIQAGWILGECGMNRRKDTLQMSIFLSIRGNHSGYGTQSCSYISCTFVLYNFQSHRENITEILLSFPHSSGVRLFEFLLMSYYYFF